MAEITIRISDRALRIMGICLGGIILVTVFLNLWSSGVFVPKYRLRVYVPDVEGLGVNAQVRLDGVDVGSVHAIELARESASPGRRIELVLRVEKRYQDAIRSDSTATVMTEGLLGNRYVSIHRGFQGSMINSDGEIRFIPTKELRFNDLVGTVEKTVNCLQVEKDSAENKAQVPPDTHSKIRR